MDNPPSSQNQTQVPAPEVLEPRSEDGSPGAAPSAAPPAKRPPHGAYRPSHKATFMALIVVTGILAVNAAVIGFVLKGQSKGKGVDSQGQVTISQSALEKIGVNRNAIGDAGIELVVNPDSNFKGKIKVAGDVSVGGGLKLSNKFTAGDASLTQLEAGKTALDQLNVNGDTTLSGVNLRNNLQVAGTTRLQGAVTISQLLTVTNNVNVSGNLSVGGSLSTNGLSVHSLSIDSTLSIGGHVITRGAAPGVGPGGALGSNGTVSISGNDAAGTVSINIGVGAATGLLANVAFHSNYSSTPTVVITPVGVAGNFYVTRSTGGFSIYTATNLPAGGYSIDYIVMQ